jgi:thiol-disulfide isomerase/thioredoxin
MKKFLLSLMLVFSFAAFAAESGIVFVGATWCGACQFAQEHYQVFQKNNPNVSFEILYFDKMNENERRQLFSRYEIGNSIPKYFFIRDGKKVARVGGALETEELQCLYNKYVNNVDNGCGIPSQYILLYGENRNE